MHTDLHRLHKALEASQQAHEIYASGMDTLNADLAKCHDGIASKALGHKAARIIQGHLGHLRKCAELHKAAVQIATGTHAQLQAAGKNALEQISAATGTAYRTWNPNEGTANSPSNLTDLSSSGELDSDLGERLTTGTAEMSGKYSDSQLRKMMAALGAMTPQNRGVRLFKNASNPHWRGRQEYPVPDLDTQLSNKY